MACRSCARAGNFGQGMCQSCTLMEAMHKPNPALPSKLETPNDRRLREIEAMQQQERRAMQERYEYERQAQQRAQQQQRSPFDYPGMPGGLDLEMMRQQLLGYQRGGPSPRDYTGKVIKQVYLKII